MLGWLKVCEPMVCPAARTLRAICGWADAFRPDLEEGGLDPRGRQDLEHAGRPREVRPVVEGQRDLPLRQIPSVMAAARAVSTTTGMLGSVIAGPGSGCAVARRRSASFQ